MGNLADKATLLIGRSRGGFLVNQVINQIFYAKKDIDKLVKYYISWGAETAVSAERVVVAGKDGAHVGLFVNENEFCIPVQVSVR